ncbi:unnamed protein product [Peniophora sp. CBMAI 1063]|nr:unnamed protein product [Peniophora sp. CBMAI 1063]
MTTVNYFIVSPTALLPELTSRPVVTCLNEFDTSELFWLWLVIEHCYRSMSIEDCRKIFQNHFPGHAAALTRMLIDDLEDGLLHVDNPWVAPSLMDLDALPQFTRDSLPLTRTNLAMAKSLLREILANDQATYALNTLLHANPTSKLHVAIIYACFDLSSPFPLALNRRLLWCLIADMLQYHKTADLTTWANDDLPPIPDSVEEGDLVPYELTPDEYGDPFCILRQLYTVLHPTAKRLHIRPSHALPWFDVYIGVDKTGCGTGGTWHILGKRQSFMMHRRDCLPSNNEPLPELGRREIRAILDAATCWAHMWAGHAVRFHVHSTDLCTKMSEWGHIFLPTSTSEVWPELNLLSSLSHRWNFTYEALPAAPSSPKVKTATACALYNNIAYESAARCVQVVDSLLMDVFAERLTENPPDAWFLSFIHLHLELEGRMLAHGQMPGGMYYSMRDAQKKLARESVDREMTVPLEAKDNAPEVQVGDVQYRRALYKRAENRETFEAERLERDKDVPVRARAMEDAENDAENTLGAVLTFEPYLNYSESEHQDWLKVLWQYENPGPFVPV